MTPPNIRECDEVLKELYNFSGDILFLGQSITDKRLKEFETNIGYRLPLDFIYILQKHNSFSVLGTLVYGLDQQLGETSLDKIYHFEHEDVENPMFPELLPFSPDAGGNHYCFDLPKMQNGLSPVVFWQHDNSYKDRDNIKVCNANFADWIQEVIIDWTLGDTNSTE
jgi:cell wall assembly regulator SMI1